MKTMNHPLSAVLALLVAASAGTAQTPAPEINFESVPNFLNLPADIYLGEVAGVATNSHGDVFVYTRA